MRDGDQGKSSEESEKAVLWSVVLVLKVKRAVSTHLVDSQSLVQPSIDARGMDFRNQES